MDNDKIISCSNDNLIKIWDKYFYIVINIILSVYIYDYLII